jgi:two-component system, response regulator PdtaR
MMQYQIDTECFFGPPDTPRNNPLTSGKPETERAVLRRILIVEDEALVAMNMESALVEEGFDVVGIVDTEADAVAAAYRFKPDVVLMDITLREGDGISAARAILKDFAVRIVFVSGNSDPLTLAAAQEMKPAGFIRKPFITHQFANLVRNALTEKN